MTFHEDTAVQAVGDDDYTTTVSDRWDSIGGMANGGYLLALAVRAMQSRVGRPDPVTASGLFLRRGYHGPATIRTELLKEGKRFAFGSALLQQNGSPVLHAHATFGDVGGEQEQLFEESSPPVLPDPDDCVGLTGSGESAAAFPGATLTERVEYRMAEVPGWATGRPSGKPSAELWVRLRDEKVTDTLCLPMLVDSMAPVLLNLGVGSTTVELTVHVRSRPAPGWLACRASTKHVRGGLHEEDVELWDSRGVLVAQSRQLGMLLTS